MKTDQLHQLFLSSTGVSTDTRKIQKDSIFFALKGDNFNANDFAAEALEKGAKYAVIDENPAKEDQRLIMVSDVLDTLQKLSTFHRKYLNIPVIALTGSNGKTTTKELLNAALSQKLRTTATAGNLNNHIGVPLTLLSMHKETAIGIVEMGANHKKEIEFLCEIAQPDYGYITNFGKAHLEGFGSVQGVIEGKKELYVHLKNTKKTLFLNIDDPLQKMESAYAPSFTFGEGEQANLRINYINRENASGIKHDNIEIVGNLLGNHNSRNMAAAYAIATYFGVEKEKIKKALEDYSPQNNRSQIVLRGNNKIILDAYNANPTSMAAALENLESMAASNKVAILGDMFELGTLSAEEHQQLVEKLSILKIDQIYLVGRNFYETSTSGRINKYRDFGEFKNDFNPAAIEDSLILIKGSRGMALERIMEVL